MPIQCIAGYIGLFFFRQEKVIYVDKDRAAAVIIGENKDLKSAMRGKRRRDRNAADANVSIRIFK